MALKIGTLNIESPKIPIKKNEQTPTNPLRPIENIPFILGLLYMLIAAFSLCLSTFDSYFWSQVSSSWTSFLNFQIIVGPPGLCFHSNLLFLFHSSLFVQCLLSPLDCKFHTSWIETIFFHHYDSGILQNTWHRVDIQ